MHISVISSCSLIDDILFKVPMLLDSNVREFESSCQVFDSMFTHTRSKMEPDQQEIL